MGEPIHRGGGGGGEERVRKWRDEQERESGRERRAFGEYAERSTRVGSKGLWRWSAVEARDRRKAEQDEETAGPE